MKQAVVEASAPGKVILCGEHAVVYGRPALALPLSELRARARLERLVAGSGLRVVAPDVEEQFRMRNAPEGHPLAASVQGTLAYLEAPEPDALLTVRSDLPIAAGLGSGAAVSVAVARAVAAACEESLPPEILSALAFEVEKLYHGTPSGIDNTVVAFEQPVFFVRGQEPAPFAIKETFQLVIADSGLPSSTRESVLGVRARWLDEPMRYEAFFDAIGAITEEARTALAEGDLETVGRLLDANHALLVELGVSLPQLDSLVDLARRSGALGAKLTGGGGGGNVVALVPPAQLETVSAALARESARVWAITIRPQE